MGMAFGFVMNTGGACDTGALAVGGNVHVHLNVMTLCAGFLDLWQSWMGVMIMQ